MISQDPQDFDNYISLFFFAFTKYAVFSRTRWSLIHNVLSKAQFIVRKFCRPISC